MTDKIRPYDRQERVNIATGWLNSKDADSSMLETAYIALRRDENELAMMCLEESKHRRALALARHRKQL